MKKALHKISYILGIALIVSVISPYFTYMPAAAEKQIAVEGKLYEFEEKSKYEISSSESTGMTGKGNTLGEFSISGNILKTSTNEYVPAYEVADDELLTFSYKYDDTLLNAPDEERHLKEDSEKTVDGIKLDNKIKNGSIILQTSLDGEKWVTIQTHTNVFEETPIQSDSFYETNNIQLVNGCYYKVIVAYMTEINIAPNNFLFINTSKYEIKKYAEVYKFYAGYRENSNVANGKLYNYGAGALSNFTQCSEKNNYSGKVNIDKKNPHFGWDIGNFCLSGYTDNGDDNDVYLKTVGNKVKLTFTLKQDIDKLDNNEKWIIAEDKKGYDEEFQIKEHNMGRGELIIKHTDSEGNSIINQYSDFLEALTSPGADTTIQLFEEGDYEIHLNYAILDKTGIDKTYYYKTSFNFKIRNGNCMVYLFDSKNSSELLNGDVTVNGFYIDTAKSSYPKLSIKKEILNNGATGLIEDTRFNRSASDGELFTDEGVYTIIAVNRYNSELRTEKRIYVGTNNILTAYMKNSDTYTIAEINDLLEKGEIIIKENGEIEEVIIETEPPVEETTETTTQTEITTTSQAEALQTETTTDVEAVEAALIVSDESTEVVEKAPVSTVPFIIIGLVVVIGVATYIFIKQYYKKS